jgi:hypothetical protein
MPMVYDEIQADAIRQAATAKVMVLTGGSRNRKNHNNTRNHQGISVIRVKNPFGGSDGASSKAYDRHHSVQ